GDGADLWFPPSTHVRSMFIAGHNAACAVAHWHGDDLGTRRVQRLGTEEARGRSSRTAGPVQEFGGWGDLATRHGLRSGRALRCTCRAGRFPTRLRLSLLETALGGLQARARL